MGVVRLVLPLSEGNPATSSLPGTIIRQVEPSLETNAIAELTEIIREHGAWPSAAGFQAEFASRPGREVIVWLAESGGGPAGLVALVLARHAAGVRASVAWLLVAPAVRRRGVGRALVAAAVQAARDRAADEVWVETRSDWDDAAGFWQAVGFRPVG